MIRILLIDQTKTPTTEQIVQNDYHMGDCYLSDFRVQRGGYQITEGHMKLAAFWLLQDTNQLSGLLNFVKHYQPPGYAVEVWQTVETHNNGYAQVTSQKIN